MGRSRRYFVKTSNLRKTLDQPRGMKKQAFVGPLFKSLKALRSTKALKASNTGKAVSKVWNAGKTKGFTGALDEAAKFKSPEVNIGKNMAGKIKMPKEQLMKPTLARGIRSAMGNAADNVKSLTRGLSSSKGAKDNIFRAGKNIKDTVTKQLRGSQYTEKEFASIKNLGDKIKTKDGKKFLSSKFLPDREIVQETGRGLLVKKRLPMRAIAPLTTSPGAAGAAASSFLAQSAFEPNRSTSDKAIQSLKDGGRFLAGDAIGFASFLI